MRRPFPPAVLRGSARLAASAVIGVTDVAEAVHATVSRPFGRPHRARGIAGWVYRVVRRVTRGAERVLDGTLSVVDRAVVSGGERPAPDTPAREAVLAALNGIYGDALAAQRNPLATPTQLRHAGRPLVLDAASVARAVLDPSETLLVQVHGV